MSLAAIQARALAAAQTAVDMNEVQKGGSARELPLGFAFARLIEVVELGVHPQEIAGQKKEPAPETQLAFALWGKAQNGESYHNEETGAPHILRLFPFKISRNEKATAFKIFRKLNWQGKAKHFAELLGEGYLLPITAQPKSKTDATIVNRLDKDDIRPPYEPVSGAPYQIPVADDSLYRLFLWDYPTKADWDALYVEGTWEAKDGKPAQSKNRTQEYILSALNFSGSPLEVLLGGGALALPTAEVAAPVAAVPATAVPVAAVAVPAVVAQAVAPVAVPVVAPAAVPVAAPVVPQVPAVPTLPV